MLQPCWRLAGTTVKVKVVFCRTVNCRAMVGENRTMKLGHSPYLSVHCECFSDEAAGSIAGRLNFIDLRIMSVFPSVCTLDQNGEAGTGR